LEANYIVPPYKRLESVAEKPVTYKVSPLIPWNPLTTSSVRRRLWLSLRGRILPLEGNRLQGLKLQIAEKGHFPQCQRKVVRGSRTAELPFCCSFGQLLDYDDEFYSLWGARGVSRFYSSRFNYAVIMQSPITSTEGTPPLPLRTHPPS
jgi:hypothetical protein